MNITAICGGYLIKLISVPSSKYELNFTSCTSFAKEVNRLQRPIVQVRIRQPRHIFVNSEVEGFV